MNYVPVRALFEGVNEFPGAIARFFTLDGGLINSAGTICPDSGDTMLGLCLGG